MNNQSKAYSIILYLVWPFSALYIGLRNFDSPFGRRILVALYAFLGFTAYSIGDLKRYEAQFYSYKMASFSHVFSELFSLQSGKFYTGITPLFTGIFFDVHHYYFLILFLVYGYFYINTIHLLRDIDKLNKFELLFFSGLFLFFLLRPIGNTAFYTGGLYMVYLSVNYYKHNSKKFLFLMLLVPLFHIGLTIYLIVPLLLFVLKNKIWFYVLFVVLTFAVGKTSFVGAIEGLAGSNPDTVLQSKYDGYASEGGQAALEERFATNAVNNNAKLKVLLLLQDSIWYFFVPFGLVLLLIHKKYLLIDTDIKRLFNTSLLFWGVSNLMLNISQGERFLVLFSFIAIALFFVVSVKKKEAYSKTVFSKFLFVFVPILFVFGIISNYATNEMFSIRFFISNFFIEIFNYA